MGCGYNLRSLPRQGICPECAKGVEQSLAARPLELADGRFAYHGRFSAV